MTGHCLIIVAVSGIIVILIINFDTNANKHIHIPEYILIGNMSPDYFNDHACAGALGGSCRYGFQMTP